MLILTKKYLFVLILMLIYSTGAYPQVNRVAQSGMTFLAIDIGARPAAMGGSFICMDNNANALFWNPAGIAAVRNFDIDGSTTSWLADMKEHAIGIVYGTELFGSVGISLIVMDNPSVRIVQFTEGEDWVDLGYQDMVKQHALGFAYAKEITERFAVGGQIKWAHEDLGIYDYVDRSATENVDGLEQPLEVNGWEAKKDVLVFEFGTIYYTGYQDLRLALSIRNFAPRTRYQLEYFELPLTFSLGMAMNVLSTLLPEDKNHKLTLSIDAIQPRDYSDRIQIGGEYWYDNQIALRAGYKFNSNLEGFATGVGVKKSFESLTARLDYSYSPIIDGIFDTVHRFSFGISY